MPDGVLFLVGKGAESGALLEDDSQGDGGRRLRRHRQQAGKATADRAIGSASVTAGSKKNKVGNRK